MADQDEPPLRKNENLTQRYAGCDTSALLQRNHAWAKAAKNTDPDFFQRHSSKQHPRYFWVGCSDSRVSAAQVLDLEPGEVFVHRNVANLAMANDPNFSASLQYAIHSLGIEHILVVGHYGCGGIKAAMAPPVDDVVGHWISPVRDLYSFYKAKSEDQLAEYNVQAQVVSLTRNPTILSAWASGISLTIHGWIYDVRR